MSRHARTFSRRSARNRNHFAEMIERLRLFARNILMRAGGLAMAVLAIWLGAALATYSISDPSLNTATDASVQNIAGPAGAVVADLLLQALGGASFLLIAPMAIWGGVALVKGAPEETPREFWRRLALAPAALLASAAFAAAVPAPATWPFAAGPGGFAGDAILGGLTNFLGGLGVPFSQHVLAGAFAICGIASYAILCGLTRDRLMEAYWALEDSWYFVHDFVVDQVEQIKGREEVIEEENDSVVETDEPVLATPSRKRKIIRKKLKSTDSRRERREAQPVLPVFSAGTYELPPLNLLAKPNGLRRTVISDEALEQNARMLETVLADFGVRGEIINVRPGPVVTLYELEPAAGVKSSRVIGLADDIARSMSAVACRVALVPGRNVIGIELPNQDREMVFLRELLGASEYENSGGDLTLALGKSIGGEPVFADLARMPHLLIAGTTGSGKSVGINTMILSLLYRLSPDQCKLILVDPKMLELSVYDGIPHLLAPVVTDPRKAVVALKWTVREMEERYRKMSKVGVRNIEGFNDRIDEAEEKGETLTRTVHTGYDEETGEPVYETEELEYEPMPFIVVVIDEVADLDDGRGQRHRSDGSASGANGARGRHSSHHGDAAAVR